MNLALVIFILPVVEASHVGEGVNFLTDSRSDDLAAPISILVSLYLLALKATGIVEVSFSLSGQSDVVVVGVVDLDRDVDLVGVVDDVVEVDDGRDVVFVHCPRI